jgi:outer membrane lipoprotein-sorting protein
MNPKKLALLLLVLFLGAAAAHAQTVVPSNATAPPVPVDEIIRKFSEKEKEFKLARANYTFKQDVVVESLSMDDRVTGRWQMTTEVGFDSTGKRNEKIVYAPADTLKGFGITAEDEADLRSIQPFVLTSDDIAKYKLTYAGQEKVDEIGCYVFEVEPKKIEKDQRYFQGKIWVDDRDFQIVKTYGKAVPDLKTKGNENLFPRFETYREQIDHKYWFPTYTRAVDTLNFSTGPVKIREIVKYQNYKRFGADVNLTFGDAVDDSGKKVAPVNTDNKAPAIGPSNTTKKK